MSAETSCSVYGCVCRASIILVRSMLACVSLLLCDTQCINDRRVRVAGTVDGAAVCGVSLGSPDVSVLVRLVSVLCAS